MNHGEWLREFIDCQGSVRYQKKIDGWLGADLVQDGSGNPVLVVTFNSGAPGSSSSHEVTEYYRLERYA